MTVMPPDSLLVIVARIEEKLDALMARMDRHDLERSALDVRLRVVETDVATLKAAARADDEDEARRPRTEWTQVVGAMAALATTILALIVIYLH